MKNTGLKAMGCREKSEWQKEESQKTEIAQSFELFHVQTKRKLCAVCQM